MATGSVGFTVSCKSGQNLDDCKPGAFFRFSFQTGDMEEPVQIDVPLHCASDGTGDTAKTILAKLVDELNAMTKPGEPNEPGGEPTPPKVSGFDAGNIQPWFGVDSNGQQMVRIDVLDAAHVDIAAWGTLGKLRSYVVHNASENDDSGVSFDVLPRSKGDPKRGWQPASEIICKQLEEKIRNYSREKKERVRREGLSSGDAYLYMLFCNPNFALARVYHMILAPAGGGSGASMFNARDGFPVGFGSESSMRYIPLLRDSSGAIGSEQVCRSLALHGYEFDTDGRRVLVTRDRFGQRISTIGIVTPSSLFPIDEDYSVVIEQHIGSLSKIRDGDSIDAAAPRLLFGTPPRGVDGVQALERFWSSAARRDAIDSHA